ncbi:MAG: GntR family transcriptional regulator [Spirochaetaceae bacterium]|jgi:GntR family transcriptional regulator|nr:GntR family transcriptional regulator [Spirochaetaceae bacterium]
MNSTIVKTELSFSLDAANGVPIYRQIIRQIEYAILSGRMQPGDKLPTIRSLAVALKINPNTIAKAYGELELRGILTTQVGSGTYVSDKKPLTEDAADAGEKLNRKIREALDRFVQEMKHLGVEDAELIDLVKDCVRKTRRPCSPGTQSFDIKEETN